MRHLDGHVPLEDLVPAFVNDAEAALPQLRDKAITAQALGDRLRRRGSAFPWVWCR
jgi:hypothetical protein